jgi:hypothetical protein
MTSWIDVGHSTKFWQEMQRGNVDDFAREKGQKSSIGAGAARIIEMIRKSESRGFGRITKMKEDLGPCISRLILP